jgi:hypothetical protein
MKELKKKKNERKLLKRKNNKINKLIIYLFTYHNPNNDENQYDLYFF